MPKGFGCIRGDRQADPGRYETAVEEVGKLGDLPYGQEGLFVLQPAVQEVAELGVALLLFSIGLEFSFTRL